jgi:hypothetical protein
VSFTGAAGATVNVAGLGVSVFAQNNLSFTNFVIVAPYVSNANCIVDTGSDHVTPLGSGAAYGGFNLSSPSVIYFMVNGEFTNGANNSFYIDVDKEPPDQTEMCAVQTITGPGFSTAPVSWYGPNGGAQNQFPTNFWTLAAGNHWVVVRSLESSVRLSWLTVNFPSPPSIITQPSSQTVAIGTPATFSVLAQGTPTLAYQWTKGGSNISGATTSSYSVSNPQLANNGEVYAVTVSNAQGSITSGNATLFVVQGGVTGTITVSGSLNIGTAYIPATPVVP